MKSILEQARYLGLWLVLGALVLMAVVPVPGSSTPGSTASALSSARPYVFIIGALVVAGLFFVKWHGKRVVRGIAQYAVLAFLAVAVVLAPSGAYAAEGDITEADTDFLDWLTFEQNGEYKCSGYTKIVEGNGEYFAIAYSDGSIAGRMKTVQVSAVGVIAANYTSTYVFDATRGTNIGAINIANGVVAVMYQGVDNDGFVETIGIDSSGNITGTIDTLEFDTADYATQGDIIHVSGNYYAIVYQSTAVVGKVVTVEIDSAGNIGAAIKDTLTFEPVNSWKPRITHVAGDYYAITYRGPDFDGWTVTVDIDDNGFIGAAVTDSLEWSTGATGDMETTLPRDNWLVIAWEDASGDGVIYTLGIDDLGNIDANITDSKEAETIDGNFPNVETLGTLGWFLTAFNDTPGGPDDYNLATWSINATGYLPTPAVEQDHWVKSGSTASYNDYMYLGGNYWVFVQETGTQTGLIFTLTIETTGAAPPTVTADAATSVNITTANLSGNVSSINDGGIAQHGFVWDSATNSDPGNAAPNNTSYDVSWFADGAWGLEPFNTSISSLVPNTTYYYRAGAANDAGYWGYSAEQSFTTLDGIVVCTSTTGVIEVVNNGTGISNFTVNITMQTQPLIDAGYLWANGTNLLILQADNTTVPFMFAPNGSNTAMLFHEDYLAANETAYLTLYFSTCPVYPQDLVFFPCSTGTNVSDSADLEPGNNFTVSVNGWVDAEGVNSNITSKGPDFVTNITASGNITATLNFTISVTATGVVSGEQNVTVTANVTSLGIWLDGVIQASTALNGNTTADTASNWTFAERAAVLYVNDINIWQAGNLNATYEFNQMLRESMLADTGAAPANNMTLCFNAVATTPGVPGTGTPGGPTTNVTARLLSISPLTLQVANLSNLALNPLWTAPPAPPPNLYAGLNTGNVPGASFFDNLLNAAGIPLVIFWVPLVIGLSIVTGLVAYELSRSLAWMAIISGTVLVYFSLQTGGGLLPFWTLVIFIIESVSLVWVRRARPAP